jgi:hypothetical protein
MTNDDREGGGKSLWAALVQPHVLPWLTFVTLAIVLVVGSLLVYAVTKEILVEIGPLKIGPATTTIAGAVSEAGVSVSDRFTSTRRDTGEYRITYRRAFRQPPAVVGTVTAASKYVPGGGPHPADTTINVQSLNDGFIAWLYGIDKNGKAQASDQAFNFVAVGILEEAK